ncbi:MAG: adenosylcobinamide-GDP ribazoletransferase [Candidatus Methanomethylophilaceae archaeon]|nr:adenosylcobinamide-GDP ribazoletransferase [Candidatus Methanomethylophilaceae archaeon]
MTGGNGTEGTSSASALKGMVSFFTLWHMDITQRDMDSMEQRFHLVPVVGLLFGLILAVELTLLSLMNIRLGFGTQFLNAMAVLLTVYIGSKFIHFDGLTDFGDGMIVSGGPEAHVRALKDTLVGAGGLGVAVAVTLTSVAVYSSVDVLMLVVLAPLVEVMVKNAMVFAAAYGRPGKGMAGRQVSMTTTDSAVRSLVVSVVCSLALLAFSVALLSIVWDGRIVFDDPVLLAAAVITGLVASSVVGVVMARVANRNFDMVNGDILGATNEVARPVTLFLMALVLHIAMAVI